MKYRVFFFTLLLLLMIGLPLLNLPLREALKNTPESSSQGGASSSQAPAPRARAKTADTPSQSAAGSSGNGGSQAASSAESAPEQAVDAAPETPAAVTDDAVPVSTVEKLGEPVLLLDKATGNVVKMSQQEYVLGAVCSEMPPSFHEEALKAQAVAAHSYILRCKEQEKRSPTPALKGAYLEIDTKNRKGYVSEATAREMYGQSFEQYYPVIRSAVQQVEDEILLYDEMPIVAAYHSISAGVTEDASNVWSGAADYLVPVESPGDRLAPDYETTESFSLEETRTRLVAAFPDIALPEDPASWFSDFTCSDSGYITSVRIGDLIFSGQKLRSIFDLRSSYLKIAYQNSRFTFTATGYGHGVGLSQYGADYMARQGADYRAILAHYYTGATLARVK